MNFTQVSSAEIYSWRKEQLKIGGRIEDINWLLDFAGGLNRSEINSLLLSPERFYTLKLSLFEIHKLWHEFIFNNVPLQYLVGRSPWRDFVLEVSPSVLIPRKETELLIDIALDKMDKKEKGSWVDLGTGSGAIAIALSRLLPSWNGNAVDCSSSALSIASTNLNSLASLALVDLHLGDWWEPLSALKGHIDLALANPPYIPIDLIRELDPVVKDNEPYIALSGGDDGLNCCRKIIKDGIHYLCSGGWLMIEHHYDQSEGVLDLFARSGYLNIQFEYDLNGIKRFAIGQHP